jgi:hypothetical protein
MTDENPVRDGKLKDEPLSIPENDGLFQARELLKRALDTAKPPLKGASVLPTECFTPDKRVLGRAAGHNIAYAATANAAAILEVKEAYDRLAFELDRRLGA